MLFGIGLGLVDCGLVICCWTIFFASTMCCGALWRFPLTRVLSMHGKCFPYLLWWKYWCQVSLMSWFRGCDGEGWQCSGYFNVYLHHKKRKRKEKPMSDNLTWIWALWPSSTQESPSYMMRVITYLTVGSCLYIYISLHHNGCKNFESSS